ncbi:MAG: ABC transporter substrate-binding protein [Actinomycetales bacterium]|jgi:peptide/nickel transport system substrate-binding protein|uniref:ABC transporter substrate-binding protein n=1 Tax=Candidatus Phosphoribacter hodrii TaxID=2953743 RepID=A0A935IU91_9MICO|nr:ABC transporter substrate-binding protein [Candidatus Phosphoribacter hodrii]MBP8837271.1 ABC transporter substrate-binding protein [Dermatophilaceae bacterium]MBK7272898.1 ABC transporter substrate-binding protein [Candidatus Phosphoribacter hodrii]MBL0004735.1 ABC transporter substrate-binding protein [Candidatus Phosphoribacter hodrii]HNV13942.1 ABC transporter substrate-binding protein [Dermatophilaceae bacterium]
MRWTHVLAVGAVASLGLTAACSAPASTPGATTGATASQTADSKAAAAIDPTAKGPAPEVAGAKKGGTLTVSYSTAPADMDPSAQFYQDSGAIMTRLTQRSLTSFVNRNGKQVLVPDLATDLGQVSADGLTWTFTLKDGIKYSDGSAVVADDIAYAVKRSFAFTDTGPTYQVDFLKDGAKYEGPWDNPETENPFGDTFAGVEAQGNKVIFHLEKRWETLPYFATFTQVSPIPKAKETKNRDYGNTALSTGPYMIKSFTQGTELTLVRNPNWDAKTDPARTAYVDSYAFKFGQDSIKVQQGILASNGPDATTLNWDGIDASLADQVTGAKSSQFINGQSSCVVAVNMDSRKIPLEVRKAIAVAYPFDDINKAAGATPLSQTPASTLIPPQIPGWLDYKLPGLTGTGNGDPVKAKEMLKAAGKEGFELVYYYTNDDPSNVAQQVNQVRKTKLQEAGFTVKDLGVPNKERRTLIAKLDGPHNMLQSPGGWCFDWPSADSIFPPMVSSTQIKGGGTNWGNLSDAKIDAEMERILKLSIADQGPEWGKFDKWLMETYLPAIPYYYDRSNLLFGTKVKNVINDPNHGMPVLDAIWVEQ